MPRGRARGGRSSRDTHTEGEGGAEPDDSFWEPGFGKEKAHPTNHNELVAIIDGSFARFAEHLGFYLTKDAVAKLLWFTDTWSPEGAAAGAAALAKMRNSVRGAPLMHEFRSHGRRGAGAVDFYAPSRSFYIGEAGDPLLLDTQLKLIRLFESHPEAVLAVQPTAIGQMDAGEEAKALGDFVLQIVRPVLQWREFDSVRVTMLPDLTGRTDVNVATAGLVKLAIQMFAYGVLRIYPSELVEKGSDPASLSLEQLYVNAALIPRLLRRRKGGEGAVVGVFFKSMDGWKCCY